MSKYKKGLDESELKEVSGGNITILDYGNNRKVYIASERDYDPNLLGIGSGRRKSFKTLEEAEDYAKENGWSTFTETYRWGKPKQKSCMIDPFDKGEKKWLKSWE